MLYQVVEDSLSTGGTRSNLGVLGSQRRKRYLIPRKLPNKSTRLWTVLFLVVSTATTIFLHKHLQPSFKAMADEMDVDQPKTKGKKEAKDSSKARFEVKKVSNEHTHI